MSLKLSTEEIQKIDTALEALKRALKDELESASKQRSIEALDDTFIKRIADTYLSTAGIMCLLEDAHFLKRECGGPCHITCVNAAKVGCWPNPVL